MKQKQDDIQETEGQEEGLVEENKLQEELLAMTDLAKQFEGQLKRYAADYQNLQRRTLEEKGEWLKTANKDLVLKILPVLDTLFLAQKHVQDKGLALAIDQFTQLLEQEGLKRIETVDKNFDPVTMETVSTKEGEKGKVLEELRAGYIMYDKVIRSAQVIVGA